jgi:hypothetical protein
MATTLSPATPTVSERAPSTRRQPWLAVLLCSVLALGLGFLTGRVTETAPELQGIAPDEVVQTIDDLAAAWNTHDPDAVLPFYAEGVALTWSDGEEIYGREAVAAGVAEGGAVNLARASEVIRIGDFYAAAFVNDYGDHIAAFQFVGDLIVHQWVIL